MHSFSTQLTTDCILVTDSSATYVHACKVSLVLTLIALIWHIQGLSSKWSSILQLTRFKCTDRCDMAQICDYSCHVVDGSCLDSKVSFPAEIGYSCLLGSRACLAKLEDLDHSMR